MEELKSEKLTTLSVRVNAVTKDRFKEIMEDGAFETAGQLMDVLLERYSNPIKINRDNEEKIKKLTFENEKIKDLDTAYNKLLEEKSKLLNQVKELQDRAEEAEKDSSKKYLIQDDEYILHIDKLNMLVLEEVAKREGKRRDQEWTVDDIINYFVEKRFIYGELNGDLKSLPDSTISKLKGQIL
jgi:hypothetical protein